MAIVDTIYRNPSRWRAVIHTQDVRHGTAGCLLSIVLFAPLFVRQFGMVTVVSVVLFYSLLIVPAATNYYSPIKVGMKLGRKVAERFRNTRFCLSYPNFPSGIDHIQSTITDVTELLLQAASIPFVCLFQCFIPWLHGLYLALQGFRVTSNQVVFFALCEKLFSPESRLSSLYFLLFYTVLAYLHKSLVKRQWSQTFYESNIEDFLKLTTWFVAVRLGKAVATSFVLLIFTMQFNSVEPNLSFIIVTFLYFLLTQKKWKGNEWIVSWFRHLNLGIFDEEEEFWVPFLLKAMPVATSALLMLWVSKDQSMMCLIAGYTNCLVPFLILKKDFDDCHFVQSLNIRSFRKASKEVLESNRVCPVCLDTMRMGRVTPCNHVYHTACIKKCLGVSSLCPLCKRSLL